jgi:hypothetical protein
MRKVLLILGLVLLVQLLWVSASQAAPPESGGFWHRVRYGETLSTIGWQYGVNPYSICAANGLGNCNYIWTGQMLWIPRGAYPHYDHHNYYYRPVYHYYHHWTYPRWYRSPYYCGPVSYHCY